MAKNPIKDVIMTNNGVLIPFSQEQIKDNPQLVKQLGNALASFQGLSRSNSATRTDFQNVLTDTSVRGQFTRRDYEYFRPTESIPRKSADIISSCMEAYRTIGLIRNVIDLMSDFGSQGIELVHSNNQIQKFYQKWFAEINGPERSERFLNLLYRTGNTVVKRMMAYLSPKHEEYLKSLAAVDDSLQQDFDLKPPLKSGRRVIPMKYSFISPLALNVLGGELGQFIGSSTYALKITSSLKRQISMPRNDEERTLVNELPADIRQKIIEGKDSIPLDANTIRVFHYKKDDWQEWADPMIFAIFKDLILLEKMKLADLAALDGAISQVRLWKLGSLEHGLFPTDAAITKLADILLSNPGGGAFDVLWGPDLTLEVGKSDVYNFLGSSKYEPVLSNIYEGLGVPPSLTGGGSGPGLTTNFVSLKTLINRLEYGRSLLRNFWDKEIDLVRRTMGFRLPARVRFNRMILSDEASEKSLLIQLVDRNIISLETVLERFGEIPELEVLRMRREEKDRGKKLLVDKMGPYHEFDEDLTRISLQAGYISPKEAGMDVSDTNYNKVMKANKPTTTTNGGDVTKTQQAPSPGRSKNAKDSGGRTRHPKPLGMSHSEFVEFSSLVPLMVWAKESQLTISNIVTPGILKMRQKKNVRSLTNEEVDLLEKTKFAILIKLTPFSDVTEASIQEVIKNPPLSIPTEYSQLFTSLSSKIKDKYDKELTVEDVRIIQAAVYSLLQEKSQIEGDINNVCS
jgi:hypothetical protein